MKSLPCFPVFFIFSTSLLFGQSAEEAVLKKIIESETNAFVSMSLADGGKTYWLLDEKTSLNVTIFDGTHFQVRKDGFLQNTEVPPAGHATVEKSNFHFIIQGDMASATYDQMVTLTATGDKLPSREMHIFHNVDDMWKIHLSLAPQIGQ